MRFSTALGMAELLGYPPDSYKDPQIGIFDVQLPRYYF